MLLYVSEFFTNFTDGALPKLLQATLTLTLCKWYVFCLSMITITFQKLGELSFFSLIKIKAITRERGRKALTHEEGQT